MNLEMLKKNNLENHVDLKLFAEHVNAQEMTILTNGPANVSLALFECFSSSNESYSFQIWISFLTKISDLFNNKSDLSKAKIKFNAYMVLLKTLLQEQQLLHEQQLKQNYQLIQEHQVEFKTLPYMKQWKKWYSILLPELKEAVKIGLIAIDDIIYRKLEGVITYLPISLMMGKELPQLKGLVQSYQSFVESVVL